MTNGIHFIGEPDKFAAVKALFKSIEECTVFEMKQNKNTQTLRERLISTREKNSVPITYPNNHFPLNRYNNR